MSKTKEKQPLEPTLDDVFQYELAKRSTGDGIAQAALAGDREVLKDLAAMSIACVEQAQPHLTKDLCDVAEWLMYALGNIERGDEPNKAFGWTHGGKGKRPMRRTDFEQLSKRWRIGRHVAALLATNPDMTESAAKSNVASIHNVSEETVRDCLAEWRGTKALK